MKLRNPHTGPGAATGKVAPAVVCVRLVVAGPALVVNRRALLEACAGNEALATHAEHTLAMYRFSGASLQAAQTSGKRQCLVCVCVCACIC